jgi:hypothetical protein
MIVSFNSTTRSKVSRRERRKAVALRVVIDFTSAFRIVKNDGLSSSSGPFCLRHFVIRIVFIPRDQKMARLILAFDWAWFPKPRHDDKGVNKSSKAAIANPLIYFESDR